jgi:hypothetical protein
MTKSRRLEYTLVLCLLVMFADGRWSQAHSQTTRPAARADATTKGASMRATGPFDVKVVPQQSEDPSLGRMSLDKHYHGDLEASATGIMLTGGDFKTGSAGYVAMEKISGTLQGHTGTFMVQHTGTLNQGAQQLSIIVVPGSGTGELAGIAGKMDIKITEGKHFYELEYTLPDAR